jgi:glycosyltransferase involved in cell wall biosynthesis
VGILFVEIDSLVAASKRGDWMQDLRENAIPKVSIVIPAYNSEKFLSFAIESVLRQSFTDWELVLVNDGSWDATPSIMHSFLIRDPRIKVMSQVNKGLSGARNSGLSITQDTPYVVFLDSDDVWEPEALAILLETMESEVDIVGAYGLARYIDSTGNPVREGELEGSRRLRASYYNGTVVATELHEPTTFYTLVVACCIQTPGVLMLRRSAIQSAGIFDETLTHYEDLDFYLRLSRNGSFRLVDTVVLNYRTHQNNHSSNKRRMMASQRTIMRHVSKSAKFTTEQRAAAEWSYPVVQGFFAQQKMTYCWQSIKDGKWSDGARQFRHATGYFARMLTAKAGRCGRNLT